MNPWLPSTFDPRSNKHYILCFPHAGGGSATFHRWKRQWPSGDVELVPVNLPGREQRIDEPAVGDLGQLLESLVPAIAPACRPPYSLLGYSMGSLIAFELARSLRTQQAPPPNHLFVAACRAPQLPREREPLHTLDEAKMIGHLIDDYGMSDEVDSDERALMQLMAPTLRADLQLFETYRYQPQPPLDLPITALGGTNDPQVPRAALEAWRAQTTSRFRTRCLPGHHFFLRTQQPAIVQLVQETAEG